MTSPRLDADEATSRAELEIELKLTTSPKNLEKLLSIAKKLDGVDKASRKTARVVSTYYDTEDRRLRRRGLTLRVRQKAKHREQTVKSTGAQDSGMFARHEWTTPLDSNKPDLTRITAPALRNRIGLILPQELKPLFKTDVKRTTLVVDHTCAPGDTARIELAFDQGRVVAGKKSEKISELELELIQGTKTALLDLARILSKRVPTILNLSSKVTRGFHLADGSYPEATTATKIRLSKRHSIEEAMVHILRPSLGQLLANRSAASCGKDIEGVHQARVSIRRILSALILFKDYLAGPESVSIKKEVRWLIDTLGEARDLDVFIDEVLAVVAQDRPKDIDLTVVHRAAKKARNAAYRSVRTALSSKRYTTAMLNISTWIEQRAWREHNAQEALNAPITDISGPLLSKRHNRVLKLGKKFSKLPAEERHEVRIALKKVRYASEFFSSLYPERRTQPYIAAMRQLQNALGSANDVATAETLTAMLVKTVRRGTKEAEAIRLGVGKVLGWHTRDSKEANTDVVALWKRFSKSRPFWRVK